MRHVALTALAACLVASPLAARTSAPVQTQCCPPPAQPTTVSLSAESVLKLAPDVATVSAGVVTTNRSAKAAMEENARRMTAVFAALRAAGIAERDIQTSGLSLQPQYVSEANTRPRIAGYQAQNTVTVKIRRLDAVGTVLDALVEQGANQVDGPNFMVDEPDAAMDRARADAMGKAMRRAELYAKAAGMQVKRVVSIAESGGWASPMPRMMAMRAEAAMDAGAPTPVAPGEISLTAQVSVVFEFE